jgi:GNAT superfamily N-acetyltransferase
MHEPLDLRIRALQPGDEPALRAFGLRIPHDDRNFLKDDIADERVVRHWIEDARAIRRVAVDGGGRIHGIAALLPGVARAAHVAELRLVVAADRRGQGLGRALAQHVVLEAFHRDIHKITVEVTAADGPAIELFSSIGFAAEALLRDQLRDADGALHDVLVFAHCADDNWPELLGTGLQDETR